MGTEVLETATVQQAITMTPRDQSASPSRDVGPAHAAGGLNCNRRGFLAAGAGAVGMAALADRCRAEPAAEQAADLPAGPALPPVPIPHFPSRLHAFVWRNWPLATPERLARVVGCEPAAIERIGRALGLGDPPPIPPDRQSRAYVTIIKRNWHLLPYGQLLDLLGWTAERLAFALREDDALFVKLGSLKPACEPLRFAQADAGCLRREEEIAAVVAEFFPNAACPPDDDLFGFVAGLSQLPAVLPPPRPAGEPPRLCFSYFALTGDPLFEQQADPFPDGLLARLAEAGANGVWLQCPLFTLAPFPWDASRSAGHERRLENLRRLVARAGRFGMKIYLYLNEPRAMPLSFFEPRPDLRGVVEGTHAALCTSVPEVREYLIEGVAHVARAVPDLGGFFSITFSENLTNCWSHNGGRGCPRCGPRGPGAVVAELNPLFREGIRRAGTRATLIAWDWVWNDDWAGEVIDRLPSDVPLMSVSEWSVPIERGGVSSEVGEYAISAIGPGPRALRHWELARRRGLPLFAKIQAGTTWELSPVPYVPAVENVARHAENLRRLGVDGLMLSWTLGGYPSPNMEAIAEVMDGRTVADAMHAVAVRRYGEPLADAVVEAWRAYSTAFAEYPYHISVLYNAPHQLGPANLVWAEPTGYRATMVGFPYDDLDGWLASYHDGRQVLFYDPPIFAGQFEKVAAGFTAARKRLLAAGASALGVEPRHRVALELECGVVEAAEIHFRSTANQVRFVMARRAAAAAPQDDAEQRRIMAAILRDEIELARRLHALQRRDSRIGFEASNQYNYVPVDLMEKVVNCRQLLGLLAAE